MQPLEIQTNAKLDELSTFRLPAKALERVNLKHPEQIESALETSLPTLILGGGSNTLFVKDFPGRVIVNQLRGIEQQAINHDQVQVSVAAGEDWHSLVRWSVNQKLWGLENLALIPGSVGAAPIQNIGAYGVELSDCLESVQVFDRQQASTRWLSAEECNLSYRDSRFKSADAGRFVILAVRLILSKQPSPKLNYPALKDELDRIGAGHTTDPNVIAEAVIRIRQSKLPDPAQVSNAGSFFKNPIISKNAAEELIARYPDLPNWADKHGIKLSAGWMIDYLKWRGRSIGDAQVYPKHALVLTNRGNATGQDVLELAQSIQSNVHEQFGIQLEPEPQLIGGGL